MSDLLRHIDEEIVELDEEGEDAFIVIAHDDSEHDPARPLVVIVHPGDMIETSQGWVHGEYGEVLARSLESQCGTAADLARWREQGADVVLLHRGSCSQLAYGYTNVDKSLMKEIEAARESGTTLYGDMLEDAGQWMLENLHIAERPVIFMAGAYADAEHGCLTALGQMLETVARGRITVSEHAVAHGERWVPQTGSPKVPGL